MGTLTSYTVDYVRGRRARSEIGRRHAANLDYALSGLDRSFGNRPLPQLGPRAIDRWLETTGHLALSTRRNQLHAVEGFCRWLVDHGHLAADPTSHVPTIRQPRSVPRALPAGDVAALYRAAPDQRGRAIVALMVGCGLRCVEVSRLDVEHYDPTVRTVEVCGKGMHERIVYVPDETALELGAYLTLVGIIGGPLIRSTRPPFGRLAPSTISDYLARWMTAAGVKRAPWDGRSAHALRHTAASDVLDRSRDLRAVQAMLGHEHLTSSEIYLRRAGVAQMREAMEGRSYRDAA